MNVKWLSKLPAPVRRWLYFSLQGLVGSRIRSTWGEFQRWERFGPSELKAAVEERLSLLLQTAVDLSEYYRGAGPRRSAGETAVEWLRRFPPLTRLTVREHFTRIVIDPLRGEITSPESTTRKRYGWLAVKTGGTTGIPTTVVHDARARDWGRATRVYAARLCGFPVGTPYFRLWGSEQELLNQEAALAQRMMRHLLGEVPLNAFRAKEAELRRHHQTILAHPEIQHLMTYVDAAASLALFLNDKSLPAPRFRTIMACAGTLLPEFRRLLETTFQAEVFDKYGSRDCCDMACECHHHHGLHVFSPNVFLEIVDESGSPCPPGAMGRLFVTLLNNRSFPLIRYDIGDLAAWAEPSACPCGSPFPRLQQLCGRQDDLLVTEDGTLQSSVFVRHLVGVSLNRQLIREWQLEQTGRHHFVFRYIPGAAEGLGTNLRELEQALRQVFGRSVTIEMCEVDVIPATASGKIRWIVNSYRQSPGFHAGLGSVKSPGLAQPPAR